MCDCQICKLYRSKAVIPNFAATKTRPLQVRIREERRGPEYRRKQASYESAFFQGTHSLVFAFAQNQRGLRLGCRREYLIIARQSVVAVWEAAFSCAKNGEMFVPACKFSPSYRGGDVGVGLQVKRLVEPRRSCER